MIYRLLLLKTNMVHIIQSIQMFDSVKIFKKDIVLSQTFGEKAPV